MANSYFTESNLGKLVDELFMLEKKLNIVGQGQKDKVLIDIDNSVIHYRSILKKSLQSAFDNIFDTSISNNGIDVLFSSQNHISIGSGKPILATLSDITSFGLKMGTDFVENRENLTYRIVSNVLICLKDINYIYANESEWKCQFNSFDSASKIELLDAIVSLISFLDYHVKCMNSTPVIR